jgi:crossover junction endodeoxyribonuclease RusA
MKNVLKLISPIPLSVNHYLGTRAIIKKDKFGKAKPMAMVYETGEAKKYKKNFGEYIKEQVKLQNWKMSEDKTQHIYCDCVFYFDRTDKDCNNYFKLLLDSITESEVVWIDDNVVCERVNRIYYDSSNPRIELEIYPVDYIGIFDNQEQLDGFESKCKTCKRYNRNCSILKKAKEGRIQEEICNLECSKYKG